MAMERDMLEVTQETEAVQEAVQKHGLTREAEDTELKEAVVLNLELPVVLSPEEIVMDLGLRDLILEQALAEEEKEVMMMEELEEEAYLLKLIP
jgi:hypothetical protein